MSWKPREEGEYPTLGYEVAAWIEAHLPIPDGEFQGQAFRLADWQLRFLVNYYRLHPDAVGDVSRPSRPFVWSRGGQLVAPQKAGKGPFTAALAIAEAYGPVLFDGWDADGQPVGRPWATPHIQVTAISEKQAENVWLALYAMVSLSDLPHEMAMDLGMTRINIPSLDSRRGAEGGRIEPVTSSARSRLGQRITFAVQDEAHDWDERNGGRKLADTQRRNLAGMGGRWVESGNAWDPNQQSVAQQTYESEEHVFKMFFDGGAGSIRNHRERLQVLRRLYADCWWQDVERISEEIDALLGRGELAQAERFFMNRVVPGEDRAFDAVKWRSLAVQRVPEAGVLITVGVDGARYEDALAVVATEVDAGFQWVAGLWEKPPHAGDDYEHPFDEVDGVVSELWERFQVWRLYADPGSQQANISPLVEKWQGRWGEKQVIEWLMNRPRLAALMVRRYAAAIASGDLSHDGDERMARHIENTRRRPINAYDEDGRRLWTISKEAPLSSLKIDAAAAGALSWEARGDAIAAGARPKVSAYATREICRCGNPERPHFKDLHRRAG